MRKATSNNSSEPEFLTIEAAQQWLAAKGIGLAIFRLRKYCRTGKLKAKKIGINWYVRRDSLEKLIQG